MAMNVPTWGNKGVSPSDERKQEGYSAGQCLPANHLNWFLNQIFTNLEDAKGQLANLTTQSGGNNTYINSVKTKLDKLVADMPIRVIFGTYTGTGGTGDGSAQTINIGVTPSLVIIGSREEQAYGSGVFVITKLGSNTNAGVLCHKITTNGFVVQKGDANNTGETYSFAAFIEY